jgi:hypothetical protein
VSLSAIPEVTTFDEALQHIELQAEQIVQLTQVRTEQAARIAWLEEQIRLAAQRRFGPSSEKTSDDQQAALMLFDEAEVTADDAVPEPTTETITAYTRRKQKGHREEQLKDLPVETREYRLPEDEQCCPQCANPLHVMGKEVRNKLKIVPAQVSREEREQARLRTCSLSTAAGIARSTRSRCR